MYDLRGLPTGHSLAADTRTLGYDNVGQIVTLDDARHDLDFDYDALGRLFDFDALGLAPLVSQDFSYDANGNRLSFTEGASYPYTVTPNSNRVATVAGPVPKTYSYDAAGNITSDGSTTYTYDDRGRLVTAGTASYTYNGLGQRVKKDNGTVTLFVYDEAGNLIGEYDAAGHPIREHVWFAGAPVAVIVGSDVHYVHTDHLGTPRAITDAGTVIWRWESDPFGSTAAQEDPDGDLTVFTYNLRFPGQYYDSESGLHYNYFRTYDPSTGRYLESDPIGLTGGLNTYGYVSGNPLSYVDPYGLYEGGGIAEVRRRQAEQAAAQAQARAREAAARQRQAQKDFERFQELCRFAGHKNCDQPWEGYNDAMSYVGDACEILGAATALYGATRVPVLRPVPKVHIYGKTPGGRPYTAHYSTETGPQRNIPGSVVDNTINTTKGVPGRNGTTVHYDPVNDVTVVTGRGQSIVSAHRGKP